MSEIIAINLLPHRAVRREQRRRAFISLCLLTAILVGVVIFVVGLAYQSRIALQNSRNEFIKAESAKLEEQIKQVVSLQQEIEGLRTRQKAVEDLQADRNQPVHLMDELVKYTPDGVHLRSIKQEGKKVLLTGFALSNERVSEFLRNFTGKSPWLERPNLIEIKWGGKLFEFSFDVLLKRPNASAQAESSVSSVVPTVVDNKNK